jgi:hypothetical protein
MFLQIEHPAVLNKCRRQPAARPWAIKRSNVRTSGGTGRYIPNLVEIGHLRHPVRKGLGEVVR